MDKRHPKPLLFILAILSLSILIASCGTSSNQPTASTSTGVSSSTGTTLDGKTLLQDRCASCHTTGRITSKSGSLEEWSSTVDRMISKGADLDPAERETLIQYLAQTYP